MLSCDVNPLKIERAPINQNTVYRYGSRTDAQSSASKRGSPSKSRARRAASVWTAEHPARSRATWKRRVVLREVQRRHQAAPTACSPRTKWNRSRIRTWSAWNTRATPPEKEPRRTLEEATAAEEHGAPVAPGPSPRYRRTCSTRYRWRPRTSTNRRASNELTIFRTGLISNMWFAVSAHHWRRSIPAESCKYREYRVLFRGCLIREAVHGAIVMEKHAISYFLDYFFLVNSTRITHLPNWI